MSRDKMSSAYQSLVSGNRFVYKLPEKSFVLLKVFNVLGNEITTLINEEKPAGIQRVEFDASELEKELSNGIYFNMLKAGDYTETKKMNYIK